MNLDAVRSNFSHYGLQAGLHDVAKKVLGRVTYLRILSCLELTLPAVPAEFLRLPDGFAGRFLSPEECVLAADPATQLDGPFLDDALAKGDRCYALLQGSALASYGWYSKKTTEICRDLRFCFDPRDVYMYKGYTSPALRGRRLHAIGMARALQALVAEGSRSIVSYVESNNFPSLRSCARLGYADVGRIYILKPRHEYVTIVTGRCAERGLWVEARSPEQPPGAALRLA